MPLSDVPSDPELWEAYDLYARYEETESLSDAHIFRRACIIMLRRRPQRSETNGYRVDFFDIQKELTEVRRWIGANKRVTAGTASTSAKYADFSRLRD